MFTGHSTAPTSCPPSRSQPPPLNPPGKVARQELHCQLLFPGGGGRVVGKETMPRTKNQLPRCPGEEAAGGSAPRSAHTGPRGKAAATWDWPGLLADREGEASVGAEGSEEPPGISTWPSLHTPLPQRFKKDGHIRHTLSSFQEQTGRKLAGRRGGMRTMACTWDPEPGTCIRTWDPAPGPLTPAKAQKPLSARWLLAKAQTPLSHVSPLKTAPKVEAFH